MAMASCRAESVRGRRAYITQARRRALSLSLWTKYFIKRWYKSSRSWGLFAMISSIFCWVGVSIDIILLMTTSSQRNEFSACWRNWSLTICLMVFGKRSSRILTRDSMKISRSSGLQRRILCFDIFNDSNIGLCGLVVQSNFKPGPFAPVSRLKISAILVISSFIPFW